MQKNNQLNQSQFRKTKNNSKIKATWYFSPFLSLSLSRFFLGILSFSMFVSFGPNPENFGTTVSNISTMKLDLNPIPLPLLTHTLKKSNLHLLETTKNRNFILFSPLFIWPHVGLVQISKPRNRWRYKIQIRPHFHFWPKLQPIHLQRRRWLSWSWPWPLFPSYIWTIFRKSIGHQQPGSEPGDKDEWFYFFTKRCTNTEEDGCNFGIYYQALRVKKVLSLIFGFFFWVFSFEEPFMFHS